MVIFSVLIYPICLILFAICVMLIETMQTRGSRDHHILAIGALMGVVALALQYAPPPTWLLADFYNAYLPAGVAVTSSPDAFEETLSKGVRGFVNLPVLAYLFSPFAHLPKPVAGALFMLFGIAASLFTWRELVRYADLKVPEAALFLFVLIGSGPSTYSLIIGNTSKIVLLLLIWGIVSYIRGKDWFSGAIFAVAALIKPALLLTGVFALSQGRWKVGLSGALICIFATLLSIIIFGALLHVNWLDKTIFPSLGGTVMAHNVQSIGAAMGRMFGGSEHIGDFDHNPVTMIAFIVTKVLQIAVAVSIVFCLVILARKGTPQRTAAMQFSFVLMAVLLLPNLTWGHYYVWAFIPAVLALRSVFPLDLKKRHTSLALLALALMSTPYYSWGNESVLIHEIFARLVVNMPFFGALILLGLMIRQTLNWDRSSEDWAFQISPDGQARKRAINSQV